LKAMVLKQLGDLRKNRAPLEWMDWPDPEPGEGELLLRVFACGVCHTELDEIEADTATGVPGNPGAPGGGTCNRKGTGDFRFPIE
jgi:propanol-preferring alcohol dehydrogenase